jgi:choline dehydrogenase-like flavoprotein
LAISRLVSRDHSSKFSRVCHPFEIHLQRPGPFATLRNGAEKVRHSLVQVGGGGPDADFFDAIVVGAGAAGGFASLLLTEANLRVLTLDAGWTPSAARAPYRHSLSSVVPALAALRNNGVLPPALAALGQKALKAAGRVRQPVQSKSFAWMLSPASFVDDRDFPYTTAPGSRFDWFRTHQLGGRMVIPGHGRQYHRLSDDVFEPDDERFPRWPITAAEITPWYAFVERHLGIVDQDATPTIAEAETLTELRERWPLIETNLGRSAAPFPAIDRALLSGRLMLRRGAVVSHVDVDPAGAVRGVGWVDRATKERRSAAAPLVFLCASALESTRILLSSGVGRTSDALGRYLMDHIVVSADGESGALKGGREPEAAGRCVHIPRLDARSGRPGTPYGVQIYRWSKGPERTHFTGVSFAEMAPRAENRVTLDPSRRDACGNAVLRFECNHHDDGVAVAAEQSHAIRQIAETLNVRLTRLDEKPAPLGTAMHECGTARMGDAPETSVLDPNNQVWDTKGLYVTDGAAFPSQGTQHPTLTIMALTARACAHAVRSLPAAAAAIIANIDAITPALA